MSSSWTARAYNARTRLGFQALMTLLEHSLVKLEELPPEARWGLPKMVESWRDMKAGRPQKHESIRMVNLMQYNIMREIPSSDSDKICPEELSRRVIDYGENLIRDGYIAVVPIELTGKWTFRRTLSGDKMWEVLERAS